MTEYANCYRNDNSLEAMFSRAHPEVIRAVNARRRIMRLPEIRTKGDPNAPPLRRWAPPSKPGSPWTNRPSPTQRQSLVHRADATIARIRAKLRQQRFASLAARCRAG